MKKVFLLSLVIFFFMAQSVSAALSKHIVDYRIKARLHPEEKAVSGQETLTWLNDSDEFISELQFHLYLNAFKNNRSTFMKESRGAHRGFKLGEEEWGRVDIKKIQLDSGEDLLARMEYIQPDDGNKDDQTVMRLSLPKPVPPRQKITLHIEFYSKLPKVFARSGYSKNFFMAGQWFPKIGVLRNGRWNCHQYHSSTEFFADFGVYEVEITVPEKYVVGATGKRISEKRNEDGTKTCTHYQKDIHDFAWAACPDFVEFREEYSLKSPPVKTEIILLVHRSHLKQKDRFLSSLKNGIEFYSQNYGPYPYPTITLVDPPWGGMGAGGMEYPTLFTSMAVSWMPKGLLMTEMVTIHEFGHGYWYGMVASNEFEEAWLDEGINSYSESKAMGKYYGEDCSMLNICGLKMSDADSQRLQFVGSGNYDPILKNSWQFLSRGSYGVNVYQKASLTLQTLENFLGEPVMAEIMRTYFERWSFKHPTTDDFIAVAEEVSGQDLGWFFDQFLKSPDKLDYALDELRSIPVAEPQGKFDDKKEDSAIDKKSKKEKTYRNEVLVVRKGELIFPQEIEVVFEKGEKIVEKWDGKERWKRYVYLRPYKLKAARLDPERKLLLDTNWMNNSKLLKPKKVLSLKYALSLMSKFQNLLFLICW